MKANLWVLYIETDSGPNLSIYKNEYEFKFAQSEFISSYWNHDEQGPVPIDLDNAWQQIKERHGWHFSDVMYWDTFEI